MKTDLSQYTIGTYDHGSIFKRIAWFLVSNVFINSYILMPNSFKIIILRFFGAKIGKGVVIKPKVNIKYPWQLEIADHVWIGEEVWLDNLALVSIKSHVSVSQGAMLLTGNHNFKTRNFDLIVNGITLEEGVWIGAKAIVCPGVTCFSHSVLTVGSIASNNLEAYAIYRGNPAVKVKDRIID